MDLSSEKLLQTAIAQNQRLKSLESEVKAAEASLKLARQNGKPDFSLGFMADVKANPILYRLPGGPGTMSLPVWRDKIKAQIAEAQANKRAAEARLSSEEIALAVQFAEKAYSYREATRNLALLRDQLVPKESQSLEVARIGYLSGQIDFFNLTDAERTLLEFKLAQVDASSQRETSLAEISLIAAGMSPAGGLTGPRASTMGSGGQSAPRQKANGGM
jgi:outer membrane protein TolC